MQLFTHLLSSYLQGMGDFFSALPRGGSAYMLCLRRFEWFLPLGEGWDGASMLDGTHLGTPTTFPRRTSPRR